MPLQLHEVTVVSVADVLHVPVPPGQLLGQIVDPGFPVVWGNITVSNTQKQFDQKSQADKDMVPTADSVMAALVDLENRIDVAVTSVTDKLTDTFIENALQKIVDKVKEKLEVQYAQRLNDLAYRLANAEAALKSLVAGTKPGA